MVLTEKMCFFRVGLMAVSCNLSMFAENPGCQEQSRGLSGAEHAAGPEPLHHGHHCLRPGAAGPQPERGAGGVLCPEKRGFCHRYCSILSAPEQPCATPVTGTAQFSVILSSPDPISCSAAHLWCDLCTQHFANSGF